MPGANQPQSENPAPALGEMDDYALMSRITAHDVGAFAIFYDRYSSTLMAFCLRALHDRMEAEDLLLDIFWEVWERAGQYDADRSRPFTYLMNLSRARLIDRLRARGARRRNSEKGAASVGASINDPESSDPGPAAGMILGEDRARVARALQALTPEQRKILDMAFFDAFTHTQIAEKLGSPLGTVKSRIRQALSKLRDLLSGDGQY
jgi:RNA polymerase sigma-70 factor, ECF subfamily